MQDAYTRLYKSIIFMVIVVLSFKLSKTIIDSFELPLIDDPIGAPAAGIFNMTVHAGSFIVFLPMMLFFIALFWFLANYLIKRFDLLSA